MDKMTESEKKIHEALAAVYKEREKIEVGDFWEKRALSQIREIGPFPPNHSLLEFFETRMWRFTPAVCGAILILVTVLFFQLDFLTDYDLAGVLFDNPSTYSLFELYDAS